MARKVLIPLNKRQAIIKTAKGFTINVVLIILAILQEPILFTLVIIIGIYENIKGCYRLGEHLKHKGWEPL